MSFQPQHFTVWTEIPVSDMNRAVQYYETVLQTELKLCDEGPNPMATFITGDATGVAGHLYPGRPAQSGEGPTVHLSCPGSLEATLERVKQAGGQVVSDIVAIPAGRFFYSVD
ncbi:MAG: VOC family protein, partial [Planctomycetota bacterium]